MHLAGHVCRQRLRLEVNQPEHVAVTKRIGGQFLIASPYLTDPNFFRTVVYIVRHDAEGAFGLVINRPSSDTLADAFTDLLGREPKRNDQIFIGGPVNGPLVGIHSLAGLGDPADFGDYVEDGDEIWVTADEDHLRKLVDRTDLRVKFVHHFSGWGPEQLDRELEAGGWLVSRCDAELLFGDQENCWETAVKRLGHQIMTQVVDHPASIDPTRN